jgi:large subunit ribosomal protein L44
LTLSGSSVSSPVAEIDSRLSFLRDPSHQTFLVFWIDEVTAECFTETSDTELTTGYLAFAGRSFSSTPSIGASSSQSVISPRTPIPTEVVRSRPAVTEDVEGGAAVEEVDESAPIDEYVPPPLSSQQLSLLYAYTAPPPLSSLSAFAARISSSEYPELANNLPLVEQCLIHESFWSGIDSLPTTSHQRTYTNFHDSILSDSPSTTPVHASNTTLAQIGNSLLGTLTTELLLSSFPNLPTRVTKAALTLYAGPKSLAQVAKSWGVGPSRLEKALVGREDEGKVSRKERAYGHLVGGRGGARKIGDEVGAKEGAAGSGLVRWNRKVSLLALLHFRGRRATDRVHVVLQPVGPTQDAVLFEDALASVSRAMIGAVYQLHVRR